MDEENHRINYRRNSDQEIKSLNTKMITNTTVERIAVPTESKCRHIQEKQRNFLKYEDDGKKLRECVLNKLWDSVPPEARISPDSQLDYLDSDETESGLDEEDEYRGDEEDKEIARESQTSKTNFRSTCISQQLSYLCRQEDQETSWEVNFDFIQAIIWLKSMATKLQRIPATEFCKVFRNQWGPNQKMMSDRVSSCEPNVSKTVAANVFPIFRKPLNPVNRELSPPHRQNAKISDTKQRERVELLKYRLSTNFDNFSRSPGIDLIPETDESETASILSINSQCLFPKIIVEHHSSAVDSGFNSEKRESTDSAINVCQTVENMERTSVGRMRKPDRNLVTTVKESAATNSAHCPPTVVVNQTDGMTSNKRRYDGMFSTPEIRSRKRPRPSISSATLKYVLRGSECNQLLLRSVKAILNVLKNEKTASSFTEWQGSVQKEAIEAIVSIVEQLDAEKGPDLCRREVVDTVVNLMKKMLLSNELDKATIWEHHRSVILELCNAFSVCTEVVDYLVEDLKNLIPVATQIGEKNVRESLYLLQKSPIIFHSLEIVLRKYRILVPRSTGADAVNTPQKIPEVTELWRKDSKIMRRESDVFVVGLEKPESLEDREKSWIRVLEELAVASTRYWPLVKVSAWRCISVLKSLRDG